MKTLHQFVAGFAGHDAISNEATVMRDIFRSWGYSSDIFSEPMRILPELRDQAFDVRAFAEKATADDIVLLHLSIGSPVNSVFASLPCRKAILYHNVTPAKYFSLINKKISYSLELGRKQIKSLASSAEVNMADSKFNAKEIEDQGYKDVKVLPLILNFDNLDAPPDRKTIKKFDDGKVNILFVGRCVPNKKLEDLLNTFFYFQKNVEPNSRLIHVGSFAGTERYYYLLLAQAKEMRLNNVYFAKSVPQVQLNAFYKSADVFLCMSEHEGFCIPIIESMYHGLPVLAYDAAAVPETMDGAGILFTEKRHEMVAEMIGRITTDSAFRSDVLDGQSARVDRFTSQDLATRLKEHLAPLLQNNG
jgi:glycosyltransferase involved in cell wall biosynthesis